MKQEQRKIVTEYQEFCELANELTKRELPLYPLAEHETGRDRVTEHIIDMLQMYHSRYGDPEERLRIVEYLEHQFFPNAPLEGATNFTIDEWRQLRQDILKGEYKAAISSLVKKEQK